jgi:hypothetical protein
MLALRVFRFAENCCEAMFLPIRVDSRDSRVSSSLFSTPAELLSPLPANDTARMFVTGHNISVLYLV